MFKAKNHAIKILLGYAWIYGLIIFPNSGYGQLFSSEADPVVAKLNELKIEIANMAQNISDLKNKVAIQRLDMDSPLNGAVRIPVVLINKLEDESNPVLALDPKKAIKEFELKSLLQRRELYIKKVEGPVQKLAVAVGQLRARYKELVTNLTQGMASEKQKRDSLNVLFSRVLRKYKTRLKELEKIRPDLESLAALWDEGMRNKTSQKESLHKMIEDVAQEMYELENKKTAEEDKIVARLEEEYAYSLAMMQEDQEELDADDAVAKVLANADVEEFALSTLSLVMKDPSCSICCSDEAGKTFKISRCKHIYCADCLLGHVKSKIDDGMVNVPCPGCLAEKSKSKTGIGLEIMLENGIINEAQYRDLSIKSKYRLFQKNHNFVPCPNNRSKGCLDGTFKNLPEHMARKTICQHCPSEVLQCSKCGLDRHQGINCQKALANFADEMASIGAKLCPKCHQATHHDGGCLHLNCENCGQAWSFETGMALKRDARNENVGWVDAQWYRYDEGGHLRSDDKQTYLKRRH